MHDYQEKRWTMFEATEKALESIKSYMKEQNLTSAVRVAMSGGG
jgi:Fe-S cluster assembly iron-binding protein IscA